jgi:hypothetical protein|tara:strand:- start:215 stop:586 length:372 start_codon:yes stop_codon:yes gene_type:complete
MRQHWLYLCTNFNPSIKTNSCVATSSNPVADVQRAKRPAAAAKPAGGCLPSGDWRLELVMGPFPSRKAADKLKKQWRKNSRGITSRRREGYKLFAALRASSGRRVGLYDAAMEPAAGDGDQHC